MELGLFQLENLFHTRTNYVFLDLRDSPGPVRQDIDRCLKNAIPVRSDEVEDYLSQQKVDKQFPILLVCSDGVQSKQLARRLESAGYSNIYIVAGGTEGLLSEG